MMSVVSTCEALITLYETTLCNIPKYSRSYSKERAGSNHRATYVWVVVGHALVVFIPKEKRLLRSLGLEIVVDFSEGKFECAVITPL